ncbi:MAG: isoprenylcysteine carboxylmethyltransferase family protein [Ignavibacteriaceae bacterium]|nr:isoprenylcysteine carboxylmethyltransferase family protein [Ignavibacteriaceae bacterium]
MKLSELFFKYRSYTPIPFIIIMIFYHDSNIWSIITGLIVASSGEFLRLWGVSWAGSETRTTGSVGGTYLIIKGPFGHLRNPLYLGNILMYTGIGIMSFAIFPWLQLVGLFFFSLQYHLIIKEEEEYLKNTFGKQYDDYVSNVPRIIPRLTSYKVSNILQPGFSWKVGLRSEIRTFQAFGFIIFTLVILWLLRRS